MESSSSWLTALLDRPVDEEAGPKPLSWLSDLDAAQSGFVEGMPFDRSREAPHALQNVPKTVTGQPLAQGTHEASSVETTGDALVDILREALGETDAQPSELDLAADTLDESEPEPEPDPIAEAFMRGKLAGKEEAMAGHKELSAQKLELRQSIRALDQAAMDALANDLCETVIALCAQTLADYVPDQGALQERCGHAARRLGSGIADAKLHLNPDDLALLEESSLTQWQVIADPMAERGGVRFETEDGSVSDRPSDWRRAIAAAIRG